MCLRQESTEHLYFSPKHCRSSMCMEQQRQGGFLWEASCFLLDEMVGVGGTTITLLSPRLCCGSSGSHNLLQLAELLSGQWTLGSASQKRKRRLKTACLTTSCSTDNRMISWSQTGFHSIFTSEAVQQCFSSVTDSITVVRMDQSGRGPGCVSRSSVSLRLQ